MLKVQIMLHILLLLMFSFVFVLLPMILTKLNFEQRLNPLLEFIWMVIFFLGYFPSEQVRAIMCVTFKYYYFDRH
jgi:hypothetical protein